MPELSLPLGIKGEEDRELHRTMAKASLRNGWLLADSVGELSDADIEQEIRATRATAPGTVTR
jgi:hypothetical protein